ncbi:unnamed protein product [Orchesella dallaii]|uniref:Thiopurine S-methyltransferase n=1 Tax=Orchesella dallaii TaxID=48710 RepID=A0ABP1QS82_9HEXA
MANQGGGILTLSMSDTQSKENLEYWENRYKKRNFEWHIEEVHPQLLKYLSKLTQLETEETVEGSKAKKFFVPLCGKTKDIPFLLKLGFEVFAVEAIDSVVQELINENNLELTFDEKRSIYHDKDEQLKIYCGDLFKCPIEEYGPFDCIWDRASFIALDYSFRPSYIDMMKRSVGYGSENGVHNFRYLLQSVTYDKSNFAGPPRCVDAADIKEFFGLWADVTVLESNWVSLDHPCRRVNGYYEDDFFEEFHFFQPKN